MAEYHVACGLVGIYAGMLNKEKNQWRSKTDVTKEALEASASYLLNTDKVLTFTRDNKRYALLVTEIEEKGVV